MPDLGTDSDDDWDQYYQDRDKQQIITVQATNNNESNNSNSIFQSNNLHYIADINQNNVFIGQSTDLPPNLDPTATAGAYSQQHDTFTNARINNGNVSNDNSTFEAAKVVIIQTNHDPTIPTILFSHASHIVDNGNCIISTINNISYTDDHVEDIYYGNDVQIVRSKNIQWYLHVPIKYENGQVFKTRVFADPGANTPCLDTDWAVAHFPTMILRIKSSKQVFVPGGFIKPEYCLWMSFPTKNGTLLKAKFLLVNNLPVKVLLDINVLKAFGYQFKEETPQIFRHDECDEIDMELPTIGEHLTNRQVNHNWFACVTQEKMSQINNHTLNGNEDNKIRMYDRLYGGGELLYPRGELIITSEGEANNLNVVNLDDVDMKTSNGNDNNGNNNNNNGNGLSTMHVNLVIKKNDNEILNIDNIKNDDLFEINKSPNEIKNIVNNLNNNISVSKFYRVLTLIPRNSFLADQKEIKQAESILVNETLTFPSYDYLKKYPELYGSRYNGLYDAIMKWIKDNEDIFAKKTFDRVTMNCEPARLGIDPEHRDKIMFAPQYPLSAIQRLHLINWTRINADNGFWYHVARSQHCIPILMVPKRLKNGTILRYRPAFDARIVNKYCNLMKCLIPTFMDFRNLHQQRGTTTMADLKNYFDCIPLHPADHIYCTCLTPFGFYTMKCLTYGHKNAAPEAQKRTNELAMAVHNCLAYIDDIQIKHPFEEGTKEIIMSLNRLAKKCRKGRYQLNPVKFFPACDESEGFGFKNTMIGEMISDSYRNKMIAVSKPVTKEEVKSLIGLIGYVSHHLWNSKKLTYWLTILEEETDVNTKKKRLKWTKQANLAFRQLQWLMADTANRILHHPTRDGRFALAVDACSYAIGAALYQWQFVQDERAWKFVMVDMWSQIMPKALRHIHSHIQEGYAAIASMEHWQFYLLRREFDFSTDNMPVARIFSNAYKALEPLRQRQFIRIRSRSNPFRFLVHHVKGVNNPIADALSRFTAKLIKEDQELPIEQQQYPINGLEPTQTDDNINQPLTDEDKRKLGIVEEEAKKMDKERIKLQNDLKLSQINLIHNNYNMDPSDLAPTERNSINTITATKERYYSYRDEINKGWSSMWHEYVNSGNYLERDKLKEFIDHNQTIMVIKNDDEMGHDEMIQMKDQMVNLLLSLRKMENNSVNLIKDSFNDEHWQHLTELNLLKQYMDSYHSINVVDEPYDYRDDIPDLSTDEEMEFNTTDRMQTRSSKKKKQQREREQRNDDDDTLEDEQLFSRLNTQFNDVRNYMQSHEDFMYQIFGHRNDDFILDFRKYRHYQENDNVLATAIKLFKEKDKSQWDQADLDLLIEWNYGVYLKLMDDDLLIDDNVLQCYELNEITEEKEAKIIVPFYMVGKVMDYAHHDLDQHHFSAEYTLAKLQRNFWWSTMEADVNWYVKNCISCQYCKGSKRHRAPLVVRNQPRPLEHVFADVLGPIYGRYNILVLVDYATGFCMLIPIEGVDALTIAKAIYDHWFRIFGHFRIFESDWGSGFNNIFMEYLADVLNCPHEIAEPRNHRSIGKVERVIGFIQSIVNHYNLLLEIELADDPDDIDTAWSYIQVLIPTLQFALNQRKMRITGVSPNMAIFGMNMNDKVDILRLKKAALKMKDDKRIKKSEYEYVTKLAEIIEKISMISKSSWEEVTYFSKKKYDEKWNITDKTVQRMKKKYKPGTRVLYYIGDKQMNQKKWMRKWTGPWIVDKHIGDSSVIIADPTTGNQKRVSFDRLKQFNTIDFIKYRDVIQFDDEYQEYQKDLMKSLQKYNVKYRNQKLELDYTKRNPINRQRLRTGKNKRRIIKKNSNKDG